MSCMFRFTSRTSLFIYIPCPTMHEGSAWFLNNVTAKGNFLISIAANRGGLLHSFKPSGKAPRCRRWKTRLCKSLTLDSMRRSKGTHEASQSKHTPVAAILAAEPRNKNLSFFHSFLSDASLTRCWSVSGEKWQVIRLSPSANKHKHGVTFRSVIFEGNVCHSYPGKVVWIVMRSIQWLGHNHCILDPQKIVSKEAKTMKIYDSCWNSKVHLPASEEAVSELVQEIGRLYEVNLKGKKAVWAFVGTFEREVV